MNSVESYVISNMNASKAMPLLYNLGNYNCAGVLRRLYLQELVTSQMLTQITCLMTCILRHTCCT